MTMNDEAYFDPLNAALHEIDRLPSQKLLRRLKAERTLLIGAEDGDGFVTIFLRNDYIAEKPHDFPSHENKLAISKVFFTFSQNRMKPRDGVIADVI